MCVSWRIQWLVSVFDRLFTVTSQLYLSLVCNTFLHHIINLWSRYLRFLSNLDKLEASIQSSCCTSAYCVSVRWDQVHYRPVSLQPPAPPPRAKRGAAEKTEPPCFSPLEVSGWLKCWEVEVNQLLTLRVILSFMVCFNQYVWALASRWTPPPPSHTALSLPSLLVQLLSIHGGCLEVEGSTWSVKAHY